MIPRFKKSKAERKVRAPEPLEQVAALMTENKILRHIIQEVDWATFWHDSKRFERAMELVEKMKDLNNI